jgi:outer membrane protein assembly factor BamB
MPTMKEHSSKISTGLRFCSAFVTFLIFQIQDWKAAAQAQAGRGSLLGENRATANRLEITDKLAADKQWSEAIDEYVHILEEAGDDLIAVSKERAVSARRLCHQRLAALPPEALGIYRDRVESQAKKWLEQGKAEREPRWLHRLVDEAFCSRYTDQALDLLGDWAFERGRFEEAVIWWGMLAPAASGRSDLVYPDPKLDLARVRAKELLARLFAGDRDHWSEDLKNFQQSKGDAQGRLAGQSGKYADILRALANRPELGKALERRRQETASACAGDLSKTIIPPQAPRRLAYESPPWPVRLESPAQRHSVFASHQPSCYPAISGDLVFISNARSVSAYNLLTARQVGRFDLQRIQEAKNVEAQPGSTASTVVIAGNRVYARLGAGGLSGEGRAESYLVCLDLPPQPDGQLHLRWHQIASDKDSSAFWEGTPAVRENHVFIGRTRADKGTAISSIVCLDADSGQRRWEREVCLSAENHNRPHLVSPAGARVIYASDAGVIVALEAATGRRAWAYRYPSRGLKTDNGDPSPRGITPAVYHAGRIFAAPADYDGILCLDALTGEKRWERKSLEVVHLLGVAKGKLIATTAKTENQTAGIRAWDAETGADLRGWIQPEDGSDLASYGRGLLAGDWVFWPTAIRTTEGPQKRLVILNQEDSQPAVDPTQFWQVRAGNMAFANGCLAVADDDNLYVYVPPARLLEQRQAEAAQSKSARGQYQLALALADAGQSAAALDAFSHAAKLARPEEGWGSFPLREQIHQDQHQYLLTLAERVAKEGRFQEADEFLKKAADSEFTVCQRAEALAQRAELWSRADPQRSLQIWKSLLDSEAFAQGWLKDADGAPQQVRWRAAGEINRLARETDKVMVRSNASRPRPRPFSESQGIPADREPRWRLPLTPCWELAVDSSEIFLSAFFSPEACLFCCRGRDLICRDFVSQRARWVRQVSCNPTWVAIYADTFVAAGPEGISALNRADGKILWEFTPPPWPPNSPLSAFQLAGSALIFLHGDSRLFAVDVETGRVLWQRAAPGAGLQPSPPGGRFFPAFLASEPGVVVQTSAGRFWILDPGSGKLLAEAPTLRTPWARPPFLVDQERVALIPNSHQVVLVGLPSGKVVWETSPSQPSLTAQAPQLIGNGRSLFQLTDGCRWARLDLVNGQTLGEKLLATEPLNTDFSALDSDNFYFVSRNVLHAHSLTDARLLWKQPLPPLSVPWRVGSSGEYLFVYPAQPPFTLRLGFFLCPQPLSLPVEIQWRELPILVCDKRTGKVAQEMRFPGANPQTRVHLSNQALIIALEGRLLAFRPLGGERSVR